MTGRFDVVADSVHDRVEPGREEREALERSVKELVERTRSALEERSLDAEVRHVGSTARDTWISGDRDIDIFVRFPPDLPRNELERAGLEVGHAVLPDGREEYAEHPYVTGSFEGFDVDLVPCYAVESATDIRSAVDRTPFHDTYLGDHLTEDLAASVRVFKQFLKGNGVYGSDLRTEGFSGYLTELLVIEFGSTRAILEAAADWHPPVRLDPANHCARSFDDPLVVIDPTDPERNVAAVLSETNFARFQHHARDVLDDPRVEVFFPDPTEPLVPEEVRRHVTERGTTPIALVFETPEAVEDDLYPQLRKSLRGIGDALNRRGFEVFRRTVVARERSALWFELAVSERPSVERHEGPPVHVREHAEAFIRTYDDETVYGPFVAGDRYVVEREREFEAAVDFLRDEAVFDARLGPAVEASMREGYEVLSGDAVSSLAADFGRELAAYFDPSP